jgi:hypothetical protein
VPPFYSLWGHHRKGSDKGSAVLGWPNLRSRRTDIFHWLHLPEARRLQVAHADDHYLARERSDLTCHCVVQPEWRMDKHPIKVKVGQC